MASRREFLQHGLCLSTLGALSVPLIGCAQAGAAQPITPPRNVAVRNVSRNPARVTEATESAGMAPPPDIFDAQALDMDFWLKPRTLSVIRPQSGERAKVLYWRDGEVIDSAYQELCHIMRDVVGRETAPIDPKLFETLWGTQAFLARYGMEHPLEILSGYRTAKSNGKLIEQGVPAARQSLHIEGKAADIRVANLNSEVLGGLVRSFRQGGVGFYYREGPKGGWIHADTGLKRTWKG
ncbi:MAG: hypothetical protein JWQ01_1988 [Massilia sp.]|nr:hypothetical protein [Massilia sp.]